MHYQVKILHIPTSSLTFQISYFFETLKMEIRQVTIPYSGKKKREKIDKENKIQQEIEQIKNMEITDENSNRLSQLKLELEII